MTVTSLRYFQSDKVSIWKGDGTLLASQSVTNFSGWLETPLATPIQLQAGQSYRLGAYTASYYGYNLLYNAVFDNTDATMGEGYAERGDTFPDTPEPGSASTVDIRYTVDIPTPQPITPTNSGNFTNYQWSGLVTMQLPATNVSLVAADTAGHVGLSSPFNVAPTPGYVTHFAWDPISSLEPISNAFGVTVTALDYFNHQSSNFIGPVAISASVPEFVTHTNTMFGNATAPYDDYDSGVTYGQSFTPQTNITVTAFRYYFGSKVSIWDTNGTLLASTNVTSTPGAWNETALSIPLQLSAGQTYIIGAYLPSDTSYLVYYNEGMSTNFADGVIDQALYTYADGVPLYGDGVQWFFVDIRYTVPILTNIPVAVSPAGSGTFTNGVWPGNLLINQFATNLTLLASDGIGHLGISNPFNVGFVPGLLDHFVWNPIPSPQTNASPFAVTITGMDHFNNPATNFNGTVPLAAQQLPGASIFGGAAPQFSAPQLGGVGASFTLGYSFTPSTNLFVTSFRHYFGSKISLWTDSGTLLASQDESDAPGAWVATALTNPVPLVAGNTYRLSVLNVNTNFWISSSATNFANGTIKAGYYFPGDGFPIYPISRFWLVDIGYDFEMPVVTSVTPAVAGNFVQGVWNGLLTVMPAATNVLLQANGGPNVFGISNPFNVVDPPLLPPLLQSVYLDDGSFQFGWGAIPGHWYQIQYKTNLDQPDWLNLGTPVDATNVNLRLSQPTGADTQRFYRVQLQ